MRSICVFGLAFILHHSLASPLGFARVFNSKTGVPEPEVVTSAEEIPLVSIEISTVAIPVVSIETTTATATESVTFGNIIDTSTETNISNETSSIATVEVTTIIEETANSTDNGKNDTSINRSKRSCRGFECEQMPNMPPSPQRFGPSCGGYGPCSFSCTLRFRSCCPRCPPSACNNPGCAPAIPQPPSPCRDTPCPPPACNPSPQAPSAPCPCPQQQDERPTPSACGCQPTTCNIPVPPPSPPPLPPRCGCTPKGCGCTQPLLPSPISIHINGNMGYPRMPFANPCASCNCPAPVCRCPSACTSRCGPVGCGARPVAPRFPDYDYAPNGPRDSDYYDYNGYRSRRSLFYLGRYLQPYTAKH